MLSLTGQTSVLPLLSLVALYFTTHSELSVMLGQQAPEVCIVAESNFHINFLGPAHLLQVL